MIKVLMVIFVAIVLFKSSWSSPNGAPVSQCQAMTPDHRVPPQQTKSPFVVETGARIVGQGQMLQLIIMSSTTVDNYFKGFMIQARTETSKIVGQFNVDGNELAILINCETNNSTATHSSRVEKNTMILDWKAPDDFVGKVNFQ